jgi:hypothetical protein
MTARSAGWWLGVIRGVLAWGHPFTALLIIALRPRQAFLHGRDGIDQG